MQSVRSRHPRGQRYARHDHPLYRPRQVQIIIPALGSRTSDSMLDTKGHVAPLALELVNIFGEIVWTILLTLEIASRCGCSQDGGYDR